MTKIDRAHKNYLTPEISEEMHLREIIDGTLSFQQSGVICIGRHGGQNYFLPVFCLTFDSYAHVCCKRFHIIFSTIS